MKSCFRRGLAGARRREQPRCTWPRCASCSAIARSPPWPGAALPIRDAHEARLPQALPSHPRVATAAAGTGALSIARGPPRSSRPSPCFPVYTPTSGATPSRNTSSTAWSTTSSHGAVGCGRSSSSRAPRPSPQGPRHRAPGGSRLGVRYVVDGGLPERHKGAGQRPSGWRPKAAARVWGGRFEGQLEGCSRCRSRWRHSSSAIEPRSDPWPRSSARAHPATENRRPTTCACARCPHLQPERQRTGSRAGGQRANSNARSRWTQVMPMQGAVLLGTHDGQVNLWIGLKRAQRVLPLARRGRWWNAHRDDPTTLAFRQADPGLPQPSARAGAARARACRARIRSSMAALRVGLGARLRRRCRGGDRTFERANRLNPVDPEIGYVLSGLGFALLMAGRTRAAIAIARKALADAPAFVPAAGCCCTGWRARRPHFTGRRRAPSRGRPAAAPARQRITSILAGSPSCGRTSIEMQQRALLGSGLPGIAPSASACAHRPLPSRHLALTAGQCASRAGATSTCKPRQVQRHNASRLRGRLNRRSAP